MNLELILAFIIGAIIGGITFNYYAKIPKINFQRDCQRWIIEIQDEIEGEQKQNEDNISKNLKRWTQQS